MSDYECVCEPMDGEPCDFVRDVHRKARKQHKCNECDEQINAGQRYWHVSGKCDGEIFYHDECEFCHSERERLSGCVDGGLVFGDLACALVAECRGELW